MDFKFLVLIIFTSFTISSCHRDNFFYKYENREYSSRYVKYTSLSNIEQKRLMSELNHEDCDSDFLNNSKVLKGLFLEMSSLSDDPGLEAVSLVRLTKSEKKRLEGDISYLLIEGELIFNLGDVEYKSKSHPLECHDKLSIAIFLKNETPVSIIQYSSDQSMCFVQIETTTNYCQERVFEQLVSLSGHTFLFFQFKVDNNGLIEILDQDELLKCSESLK